MLAKPGATLAQTQTLVSRRYFLMSVYKLMGPFDLHCMSFSTYIPFSQEKSPRIFEVPGVEQSVSE